MQFILRMNISQALSDPLLANVAWARLKGPAVSALPAHHQPIRHAFREGVRIGFIGLNDCAPLVAAQEFGFFARHGLKVTLRREVGWAAIRDKVLFGELDAAHAPAGMVLAATHGIGSVAEDCLTALVINLHGNAIVLSQRLRRSDVVDGHSLREHLRRKKESLTFGVVYQWSSHHVLLRQWLVNHGISPDRDVRIVVVPPSQVLSHMRAGHIDGYCVGEPWASLAVLQRSGWVVARSEDLAPSHPEKVLMVRRAYAERSHEEHMSIVAALLEACAFCAQPENREELISILARREYVGAPIESLRASTGSKYDYGFNRVEECSSFNLFSGNNINEPTLERGNWVRNGLVKSGLVESLPDDLPARCFRMDLHSEARALIQSSATL